MIVALLARECIASEQPHYADCLWDASPRGEPFKRRKPNTPVLPSGAHFSPDRHRKAGPRAESLSLPNYLMSPPPLFFLCAPSSKEEKKRRSSTRTNALLPISQRQTQHMPVNIAARFLLIRARRWLITQTNWNRHAEWALIKERENFPTSSSFVRALDRLRLPDRVGGVLAHYSHYSLGRLLGIIRRMTARTECLRRKSGNRGRHCSWPCCLETVEGLFFFPRPDSSCSTLLMNLILAWSSCPGWLINPEWKWRHLHIHTHTQTLCKYN